MAWTLSGSPFYLSSVNRKTLAGAGVGVSLALLGVIGRKLLMQAPTVLAGNWDEALAAEHKATLAVFDKLAGTRGPQKAKRTLLLAHLRHALTRHAMEEENVIYPAMRDAGLKKEADALTTEHGYVKQHLYDLEQLLPDNARFQARLASFRSDIEAHMADEEGKLFPRLRETMDEEANAALTARMNKAGLKVA